MSSVNQRGWTPIESDTRWEDEDYFDKVKAECDGLALWWSELHHEEEQEMFRRQSDREDGGGYDPGEDAPRERDYEDTPEGAAEFEAALAEFEAWLQGLEDARNAKVAKRDSQMEFCETKLYELGARMMRPYEHWNEDERWMEYQERDR